MTGGEIELTRRALPETVSVWVCSGSELLWREAAEESCHMPLHVRQGADVYEMMHRSVSHAELQTNPPRTIGHLQIGMAR